MANESLGRPQEILYIKIKDVELFENYAKLYISEHGKEGCGFLQCIDSYPYLIRWLEEHPLKNDPEAFLFINLGNRKRGNQLTPQNINSLLKTACTDLGINKRVTCYSLKRNGVTFRRLKGESDVEIQHAARWTSTRQLSTYDFSNQEDALKKQLIRKGIIQPGKGMQKYAPESKACSFCDFKNGFTDEFCGSCKRPLNGKRIKSLYASEQEAMLTIKKELADIRSQLVLRKQFDKELAHILKSPQVQKIYQEMCREKAS